MSDDVNCEKCGRLWTEHISSAWHDTPMCPATPQLPIVEQPKRKSWDAYFMDIAAVVATRATCDRAHVGAVIVMDKRVLATGYNGSVRGTAHCDDVGHDLVESIVNGETKKNCVRTVHAEVNAIAQAASYGAAVNGATLYVTHYPCWPCAKLVFNAGIKRIVYASAYNPDVRVLATATSAGFGCEIVEMKP